MEFYCGELCYLLGCFYAALLAWLGGDIRVLATLAITYVILFSHCSCAQSCSQIVARPAIEPIYFSLPATLLLSLYSFPHFSFLLHIRLSSLDTPYASDILPETFHALVQLGPGVVPLLPRAAISVVLLATFSSPFSNNQTSASSFDQSNNLNRDPNFFDSASSGRLTTYARGVSLSLILWVAIRLLIILVSTVGLWSSSRHSLGGGTGSRYHPHSVKSIAYPSTPREPGKAGHKRDPAQTRTYQKCGISEENEFQWEWKDRARSRIQNAFELCMIRQSGATLGTGRGENGRMREQTKDIARIITMQMSNTPQASEGPSPSRDIYLYQNREPIGLQSISKSNDPLRQESIHKLGHLSVLAYDSAISTSSVDLLCSSMNDESLASGSHHIEAESDDSAHFTKQRVSCIPTAFGGLKRESMEINGAHRICKTKDLIGQDTRGSSEQSSPWPVLRHPGEHKRSLVSEVSSTRARSTSVNLQQLTQSFRRDAASSEGIVKRVRSGLTSGSDTLNDRVDNGESMNEGFERIERECHPIMRLDANR